MTGSRLAALLDQMEPGPWSASPAAWETVRASSIPLNEPAARLIALAPDMAQLLVDMADALADRNLIDYEHGTARGAKWRTAAIPESVAAALLARFAALDEKAGGA